METIFTKVCGWLATILFFASYFPQLVRTFRLKSVDDISINMWWLTAIAYSCLFIYGLSLNALAIMVNAMLGFSCVGMMLIMYYLYRDPRKDRNRRLVRGFLNEAKKKFKEKNGD